MTCLLGIKQNLTKVDTKNCNIGIKLFRVCVYVYIYKRNGEDLSFWKQMCVSVCVCVSVSATLIPLKFKYSTRPKLRHQ